MTQHAPRFVRITAGRLAGTIAPVIDEDDQSVRVRLPNATALLPRQSTTGIEYFRYEDANHDAAPAQ